MTDAQEDEMADWLKNLPEMYNKGKEQGHGQEGGFFGHPGQHHGHGR